MRARLRDTEIYFDVEGMGLVPDGAAMRELPPAFLIHGGPGGDHTGFKPVFSPLATRMQLVYFDHRGQGRSAKGDPASYTLDRHGERIARLGRARHRVAAHDRLARDRCPERAELAGRVAKGLGQRGRDVEHEGPGVGGLVDNGGHDERVILVVVGHEIG